MRKASVRRVSSHSAPAASVRSPCPMTFRHRRRWRGLSSAFRHGSFSSGSARRADPGRSASMTGFLKPRKPSRSPCKPAVVMTWEIQPTSSVTIDDAADVLYVAQLRSVPGLNSSGKGVASVRKAGNSLSSRTSLSFGGLSGAQSAAEIYHSTNQGLGGPAVFTFPPGQVPALGLGLRAIRRHGPRRDSPGARRR